MKYCRVKLALLLLAAALALPGCSWFFPEERRSAYGIDLVGGSAKVLTVDQDLGCVVVQTDRGERRAYWNEYTEFTRGDRRVRYPRFQEGDQFVYRGFEGDNEIYLRRVAIKVP